MKRVIYTSANAHEQDFKKEMNFGESLAIPDQAITPQELLRRYATGQPLGFKNVSPVYDSDEDSDIPEFYKMNKLDRMHAMQENHFNVKEKMQAYNAEKEKFQQKQKEKKINSSPKKESSTQVPKEDAKERSDAKDE
jgi:hypothetical protein